MASYDSLKNYQDLNLQVQESKVFLYLEIWQKHQSVPSDKNATLTKRKGKSVKTKSHRKSNGIGKIFYCAMLFKLKPKKKNFAMKYMSPRVLNFFKSMHFARQDGQDGNKRDHAVKKILQLMTFPLHQLKLNLKTQ